MFIQRPWLAYTFDGGPSSSGLFTDIADGEQPLRLFGQNGSTLNILSLSGGAYGQVQGNPFTGDAMTFTFRARFDSLNPWSRVFDFGDGPDTNNILFGNVGTTNDATFRIVKNGVTYAMTLPDAIELGSDQIWTISIDANGLAKVSYTEGTIGTTISIVTATAQMVRIDPDQRSNMYIGRSNWSTDGAFHGSIDNFFVYNYAMSTDQAQDFIAESARMREQDNSLGADIGRHWVIGQIIPNPPIHTGVDETLNGSNEGDVILPNGGNDTVNGFGGDDILIPDLIVTGQTAFYGGTGIDTVVFRNFMTSLLVVDLQMPWNNSAAVSGDTYVDVENLRGLKLTNNDLRGNGVGNVLTGGDGNDLLRGRGGSDILQGNGGYLDLADYTDGTQPVLASLLSPWNNSNDAYGDVYDDIHGLIGTAYGDLLIGDNRSDGLYTSGPFAFSVGPISNYIEGGDGDDTLYGAGGRDVLSDGLGNDTIYGDQLPSQYGSVAPSQYGDDIVYVGAGLNTVYADAGNDIILQKSTLTADRNTVLGEEGNDLIGIITTGSGSTDYYYGGNGFDLLHYGYTEASASSASVDLLNPGANGGMAANDTIQDIESLRGSRMSNTFSGSNAANLLIGGGGQDYIYGRGGADILLAAGPGGLTQADLIQAASGVRSLSDIVNEDYAGNGFFGSQYFVQGDSQNGYVYGQEGNDTLIVSRNALFNGGADDDVFYLFDAQNATVDGDTGSDTLILPLLLKHDFGTLETFDYTIDLVTSANTVNGAQGFVLANVENVIGGYGADTLRGNSLANLLVGGLGTDTLLGREGIDELRGDGGIDRLDGGDGADVLKGGAGSDTYVVDNAGDQVVEQADEGTDWVETTLTSYTLTANVENLDYVGPSAANFTGIGNDRDNSILGFAGNDTLNGRGGADILRGYSGNDTYVVDQANDQVIEYTDGGIADRVNASASYTLAAGVQVEILGTTSAAGTTAINLTGNELVQTLYGNAGVNTLKGGGGADLAYGYGGNDTYIVDNLNDKVFEAAGGGTADRVNASTSYVLAAGQQVEILGTTSAAGTGAINLTGNEFSQTIYGNAGANYLNGLGGPDTLQGFGGADFFSFTSPRGTDNIDRILDFSAADDTIRLAKGIFAALNVGTLSDSAYKDIGDPGATVDLDDRILYNDDNGALYYDTNGSLDGGRLHFATLVNRPATLTGADFIVVA